MPSATPTRASHSTTRLTTPASRRSWAKPARGRPPTSCGSRSKPRGRPAPGEQALPRFRGRGAGASTRADRASGRCSALERLFDPARDGHDFAVEAFLLESVVPASDQVARRVHGGPAPGLGSPAPRVNLLAAATACTTQGQDLFAPPSVKGWEGGKSWINSSTILERLNWATDIVWGNPERGIAAVRPGRLGSMPAASNATKPRTPSSAYCFKMISPPRRKNRSWPRCATRPPSGFARPFSACSTAPNSSSPEKKEENRP